MARFCGKVGYAVTKEKVPGVYSEDVSEVRTYYGDILKNNRRFDYGKYQNDNLRITNRFSIVADPYAYQNYQNMRYLEYNGVKWKVREVTIEYPRLILDLGDEWNGEPKEED